MTDRPYDPNWAHNLRHVLNQGWHTPEMAESALKCFNEFYAAHSHAAPSKPTEAMVEAAMSVPVVSPRAKYVRDVLSAALAHPGQVREIAIKPLEPNLRYEWDGIAGKMRYFGSGAPNGWMGDDSEKTTDGWFSQVVSFFVKHDMLDPSDEYDISDVMAALEDNYTRSALALPLPVQEKPVAWMFEGKGWGREVMLSEQEALERKERLSRTWDITITPLYLSPFPSIPEEKGGTAEIKGWFVKDFADGWIFFDNEEDASREVDATGAMMLVGFHPSQASSTTEGQTVKEGSTDE